MPRKRAADIWSLGIILANLACGKNPWSKAAFSDPRFHAYVMGQLPLRDTVMRGITLGMERIILQLLSVDARQRPSIHQLVHLWSLVDISIWGDHVGIDQPPQSSAKSCRIPSNPSSFLSTPLKT